MKLSNTRNTEHTHSHQISLPKSLCFSNSDEHLFRLFYLIIICFLFFFFFGFVMLLLLLLLWLNSDVWYVASLFVSFIEHRFRVYIHMLFSLCSSSSSSFFEHFTVVDVSSLLLFRFPSARSLSLFLAVVLSMPYGHCVMNGFGSIFSFCIDIRLSWNVKCSIILYQNGLKCQTFVCLVHTHKCVCI